MVNMSDLGGNPNSKIGGASGVKALSVPQIAAVFSFHVEGGDIYVYLVKSSIAKFAIITFDNTIDEYAFAIQTLTSNSKYEAVEMVRNAEKSYNNFAGDNPFTELYEDPDAMEKLASILAEFYNGE